MANVIGEAVIVVGADGQLFAKQVDKEADKAGKSGGAKFGKSLTKALKIGAVAAATTAVAGIALVFKTGIGEAMDASKGLAQLNAGLKSTHNVAGVTAKGMEALASSIQGYSGQTDDSIVATESLLLTFTKIRNTKTDKIFDQATKAAADMAAKMGGDASSKAVLLGKALNDPVKGIASLTRVGVTFSAGQKKLIEGYVKHGKTAAAQKVILKELSKEFGGAAKAAGDSLPGKLEKAKRSFEDVSQSVVETLLPMVLPGLTKIGDLILKKVMPAVQGFVTEFANGTGAGGKLRDALDLVWQALKTVGDVVVATTGFFKDHQNATKALATVVVAALGLVAAAWVAETIVAVKKAAENALAWLSQAAAADTSTNAQMGGFLKVAAGWVLSAAKAVWGAAVVVGGWIAMAAAAVFNAAMIAGAFVVGLVEGAAEGVAAMAVAVASTVAGWVTMAVQATLNALKIAAAWLIALGPIGIVIAVIIGLVALFAVLWKKSDTFRRIVTTAFNAVKDAAVAVFNWIKANWPTILAILTGPIGIAVLLIVRNWAKIKAAGAAVLTWIKSAWGALVGIFTGIAGKIGSAVIGAWNRMKTAASKATSAVVGYFKALPGRLLAGFGAIGTTLYNAGKDLIQGLANGIGAMAGVLKDALLSILPGPLKKFAGQLGLHSPSKLFIQYGKWIVQGLVLGLQRGGSAVVSYMSTLAARLKKAGEKGALAVVAHWKGRILNLGKSLANADARIAVARDNLQMQVDAYNETFSQLFSTLSDSGTFGDEATKTFDDIVNGLTDSVTKTKEFAAALATLKDLGLNKDTMAQISQAGLSALGAAQALAGAGKAGVTQVNDLQDQLNAASTDAAQTVASTLSESNIVAAQKYLDTLLTYRGGLAKQMADAGNAMVRGIIAAVNKTKGGLSIAVPKRKRHAAGTKNYEGGLGLFGERGPELAVAPRGTQIVPASATAALLRALPSMPSGGAGGGGSVNTINQIAVALTVSVDDLAKLSRIDDFLRMLDNARVNSRRTMRSGTVPA